MVTPTLTATTPTSLSYDYPAPTHNRLNAIPSRPGILRSTASSWCTLATAMSHTPTATRPTQTLLRSQPRVLKLDGPLVQSVAIAIVWRIVVGIAGAVGNVSLPKGKFTHFSLVRHGAWPSNPITLAIGAGVRNDALWYARVVQHGYTFSTHRASSIAFYPLYPLLVKAVSFLLGDVYVSGMVVSTACLLAAIPLLHAWMARRGLGHRTPLAVLCLLLFPWSLFYAAMYSESLYLLLVLGAFLWYEREHWLLAAACTFLLTLSRPTGILIVPALFLVYNRRPQRELLPTIPLLAALAGVVLFSAYQWIAFGTPTASWQAATVSPWSRGLHQALLDVTLHARPGFPSWYFAFMIAIGLLVLLAVPMVNRRFGPAYALFAALTVLLPAASGLISLERYVVGEFPVFVALACIANRRALVGTLVFEFYFLLFFSAAFAAGWAVF
jgi:hypothetical protein